MTLSGPVPAYNNPPIQPEFYQPSRFEIIDIVPGKTTTITTSVAHNYVVAQLIRLLIPQDFGAYQLNGKQGFVISIPSTTEVEVDIDSTESNAFIVSPYLATITNATQASSCVVTANNSFLPGQLLTIIDVEGMTQLNGTSRRILSANATSFTLDLDSSAFGAYTMGGTAQLQANILASPQILAIGDIGNGQINATGRMNQATYIPGSFINISPG